MWDTSRYWYNVSVTPIYDYIRFHYMIFIYTDVVFRQENNLYILCIFCTFRQPTPKYLGFFGKKLIILFEYPKNGPPSPNQCCSASKMFLLCPANLSTSNPCFWSIQLNFTTLILGEGQKIHGFSKNPNIFWRWLSERVEKSVVFHGLYRCVTEWWHVPFLINIVICEATFRI